MVAGETENEEQYYDYAAAGHDKRFFDDNNNDDDDDGSVTGDVSSDEDDEENHGDSLHSYDFEKSQQNNFNDTSYYSEEEGSYDLYGDDGIDDDDDDDDSLGFPPGHITRLDEMHVLKNNDTNNNGIDDDNNNNNSGGKKTSSSVNPSIIPSYFFCPITQTIMKDPVITPDGTTFERRAILRSLILQPEINPITGRPLLHTELVDDQLVRTSIDKARKEAWVRYVVEFEDDSVDDMEGDGKEYAKKIYEEKVIAKEKRLKEIDSLLVDITGEHSFDEGGNDRNGEEQQQQQQESPSRTTTKVKNDPQAPQSSISISSPTLNSTFEQHPGQNHGWLVPLGVHKIICSSPGLIVTADVHRRSKVVKRRMLKKSLAGGGKSTANSEKQQMKKKQSIKKRFSPRKQSHRHSVEEEYKRRVQNIKTTTTAITEDLILPPGSHVDILETRIHGGRVRGKITWEEEVTVQLDDALVDEIKRQEEIVEMMSKVTTASSEKEKRKKKGFFRRKQLDKTGGAEEDDVATSTTTQTTVPYTSNLSTNEIPSPKRRDRKTKKKERSPSPITSIKYTGWISLQWAGEIGNHEKDEAMRRRRDTINDYKLKKDDDYHPHLIADEDDGPWSRPLPLGVYRIGNDNVSVSDVPEVENLARATSTLVKLNSGDLVEVVEMQVVMIKRKVSDPRSQFSMLTSDFEGVPTVRARCMMSSSVDISSSSATPKRFKSGWITLSEEGKSSDGKQQHHIINASPIPVGAHVVSSNHGPLMSCVGSKIKTILPSGSCMEVDATRIDFDESETVECKSCRADCTYPLIAVKALISLGGYATLFTLPVKGKSSLCSCGQILSNPTSTHFAEPVKLGVYKVIHPDGVFLTEGIGPNTPVISTLKQNALAEVTETRVEDGCVRGKINIFLSCDLSEMGDKNTGWISLFEPPNCVWAELVTEKKGN